MLYNLLIQIDLPKIAQNQETPNDIAVISNNILEEIDNNYNNLEILNYIKEQLKNALLQSVDKAHDAFLRLSLVIVDRRLENIEHNKSEENVEEEWKFTWTALDFFNKFNKNQEYNNMSNTLEWILDTIDKISINITKRWY